MGTDRGVLRRKKEADLYRGAAVYVESHPNAQSCCAITRLVSMTVAPIVCAQAQRYVRTFSDVGMIQYGHMVQAIPDDDQQGYRVLALCFMAAMVEAGDA